MSYVDPHDRDDDHIPDRETVSGNDIDRTAAEDEIDGVTEDGEWSDEALAEIEDDDEGYGLDPCDCGDADCDGFCDEGDAL